MPATWTGDPGVWVQIEETLGLLPIKRRRLLLEYWQCGNIAEATRRAGYDVKNVKSACEVGREILADPKVAWCTRAIFEAECGGAEKLRALLGVHAAGFDSPSEGDRDRSLRAASLIYKHGRPRPIPGAKPLADQLLDEMTEPELEHFIATKQWPARFAARLTSTSIGGDTLHHHAREERPGRVASDEVHPAYTPGPRAPRTTAPEDRAPEPSPPSVGPTTPIGGDDWRQEIARDEQQLRDAQRPIDPALAAMAVRDRRW